MTDLWTEASIDTEQATLDRHLTAARVASAPVWPFLAQATSPGEYANRKALVADRVDRIAAAVADGDPALFSVVRASLDDGFDADFAVLHADRVATAKIEAEKTAAQQAAEAQIRAQVEREALEQVLAADKTAAEYGGGSPKSGDTATCHKDGGAIQFFDGQWMHLKGTGDSHNDVYPATPKEQADADAKTSTRKTALTLGELDDRPYEATCPNPDCEEQGTAFVHDDFSSDNDGDDETVECPVCNTPLVWMDGKTAVKKAFKRRASLEVTAGHEIYVTKKPPCDVCRQQGQDTPAEYDSRLPGLGGSWGNVCQRHFDAHGPGGTGTGHAQRYVQREAATTASLSPEVAEELQRRATVQASLTTLAEFPPKKDGNPFGGGHDNPAEHKPDDGAAPTTWKCPACGSSNAFTQGGIELADALKQHQPIQCGDCKQIDQSGGQGDANAQQQQPGQQPHQQTSQPQVPPPHHGAKTAAGDNPYAGDANPYTQQGTPDDQMDGPQPVPVADAAPPESTRPRVMPSDPTPPPVAPVPAAPAAPAGPADPAGGGDTPPPKKAAGLGFHSASFVKD